MEIVPDDELRARLAEAADNAPSPEIAHQALGLLRPSIALAPAADGQGCGTTRLGGLPPLLPEAEWPATGGRPRTLVARLDCAALHPLLGDEWPLPRDGLLLFFYDDTFGAVSADDVCLLHVPGDAPERPAPPDTPVIPPLPLVAARTPSLPVSFSRAIDALPGEHDLIDAMDAVEALAGVLPEVDYRLLGWHDGGGDGPDGQRPLLQLEGVDGIDWGEVVNITFWIGDADLSAGRLEGAYSGLEVA
ncbi:MULTISPECIES: DUF1963 domain-containing protein [unclassified Spirillospora]|uniref:DUF1963 domain-containing protein n=1 Tax=unclassified Spirillospora TaxID=2642701 RepID=UPI00370F7CF1